MLEQVPVDRWRCTAWNPNNRFDFSPKVFDLPATVTIPKCNYASLCGVLVCWWHVWYYGCIQCLWSRQEDQEHKKDIQQAKMEPIVDVCLQRRQHRQTYKLKLVLYKKKLKQGQATGEQNRCVQQRCVKERRMLIPNVEPDRRLTLVDPNLTYARDLKDRGGNKKATFPYSTTKIYKSLCARLLLLILVKHQ